MPNDGAVAHEIVKKMEALDKLIAQRLEDAQKQFQEKIFEAEREADSILANARANAKMFEAERQAESILANARAEAQRINTSDPAGATQYACATTQHNVAAEHETTTLSQIEAAKQQIAKVEKQLAERDALKKQLAEQKEQLEERTKQLDARLVKDAAVSTGRFTTLEQHLEHKMLDADRAVTETLESAKEELRQNVLAKRRREEDDRRMSYFMSMRRVIASI
jgi:hypothetical protein